MELYEECCDVLLGYWDTAKGLAGELQPRQKRTVLQPLAFYLHQNGLREEKRDKFLELLENELPKIGVSKEKAGDFFDNIKERCGVLVETRIDHFGFSHLTFQEFLTARHILDSGLEDFLISRKNDKFWFEVTLLYCGMKNTNNLLNKILDEKEDIFHNNHFFAGKCLAESLSVSPELRTRITEKLYNIYWDEKELGVSKETSLEVLKEIKDQGIIQKLIEETRDKESDVRWRAAYALGQIGDKKAVESLKSLLNDREEIFPFGEVRVSAFNALKMIFEKTKTSIYID
ncbi:MAG: HEAT repeat domain-containing protein [candidate division Zixibacteria bacterium]|nr:HEAT repeat domain-containing protein [candidate division Zixibacteria bacterium]